MESFESTFGRLELLEPGFSIKGIAKTKFPEKSFFVDFGVDLFCFLDTLGAAFLIFVALETGLNINGLSMV